MNVHSAINRKAHHGTCMMFRFGVRRSINFRLIPRFRIDGGLHFFWLWWAGWVSYNNSWLKGWLK